MINPFKNTQPTINPVYPLISCTDTQESTEGKSKIAGECFFEQQIMAFDISQNFNQLPNAKYPYTSNYNDYNYV